MVSKKSKLIVTVIIFVLAASGTLASFTYAFFTVNVESNNILNIAAIFDGEDAPVFLAHSDKGIEINVTQASMLESEKNSLAKSVTANLSVELTPSTNGKSVTCTYDLVFSASSEGFDTYVPSPIVNENDLKEFTLKITSDSNDVLSETQVDKLTSNIATGQSITASGTNTQKKIYEVTASIYNLDIEQNIFNKKYKLTVKVANPSCVGDTSE